jgi:1-deoxy-D-xylulose 5-phosphate reductoisomerase
VLVAALLARRILYGDLAGLVAAVLERRPVEPVPDLESALAADAAARRTAGELLAGRDGSSEQRGHS